jgi:ABC-type xylose transport system substrate-binding protein
MTVYKPIKLLADQAATVALKLAQQKVIVAKDTTDNGHGQVPSILLEIVPVTKDNLRETVIADGFRKEGDVFSER